MALNTLRQLFSVSIAKSLNQQKKKYYSSKWAFSNDILCEISQDYKGTYISACLKTNDPYAGGFDISGQVFFYKKYFANLYEALSNLTKEG